MQQAAGPDAALITGYPKYRELGRVASFETHWNFRGMSRSSVVHTKRIPVARRRIRKYPNYAMGMECGIPRSRGIQEVVARVEVVDRVKFRPFVCPEASLRAYTFLSPEFRSTSRNAEKPRVLSRRILMSTFSSREVDRSERTRFTRAWNVIHRGARCNTTELNARRDTKIALDS